MSYSLKQALITAGSVALACCAATTLANAPVQITLADADDKIAEDICASKTGDARDACLREAQDRQISSDARADTRADSKISKYNAARAKCDSLAGIARDNCIASAKAKYKP